MRPGDLVRIKPGILREFRRGLHAFDSHELTGLSVGKLTAEDVCIVTGVDPTYNTCRVLSPRGVHGWCASNFMENVE